MKEPEASLHILLADDDHDDQELFQEILNELKVNTMVTVAVTGGHMLIMLENFPTASLPNLIFLDINMPCQSGIDCLSKLRSTPRYNDIRIIMWSTSTADADIDNCYSRGANLYLPKDVFFKLPADRKEELIGNYKHYCEPRTREQFVVQLDSF
jgi:CheY-like chemotaxis protein